MKKKLSQQERRFSFYKYSKYPKHGFIIVSVFVLLSVFFNNISYTSPISISKPLSTLQAPVFMDKLSAEGLLEVPFRYIISALKNNDKKNLDTLFKTFNSHIFPIINGYNLSFNFDKKEAITGKWVFPVFVSKNGTTLQYKAVIDTQQDYSFFLFHPNEKITNTDKFTIRPVSAAPRVHKSRVKTNVGLTPGPSPLTPMTKQKLQEVKKNNATHILIEKHPEWKKYEKNILYFIHFLKFLDYSPDTIETFISTVFSWKTKKGTPLILHLKNLISTTRDLYNQGTITLENVIKEELTAAKELSERIGTHFSYHEHSFSLKEALASKETNCLGYSQIFLVLGRHLGLNTTSISYDSHIHNLIFLSDKTVAFVDIASALHAPDSLNWQTIATKKEPYHHFTLKHPYYVSDNHDVFQTGGKNLLKAALQNSQGDLSTSPKIAIEYFTEAIRLNPYYANAYRNRGDKYYELGEYTKAALDYSKTIELSPSCLEAYFARGNCYAFLDEHMIAIADYAKTLEIDPHYNHRRTHFNTGISYLEIKKYKEAIRSFLNALFKKHKTSAPKSLTPLTKRILSTWHLPEWVGSVIEETFFISPGLYSFKKDSVKYSLTIVDFVYSLLGSRLVITLCFLSGISLYFLAPIVLANTICFWLSHKEEKNISHFISGFIFNLTAVTAGVGAEMFDTNKIYQLFLMLVSSSIIHSIWNLFIHNIPTVNSITEIKHAPLALSKDNNIIHQKEKKEPVQKVSDQKTVSYTGAIKKSNSPLIIKHYDPSFLLNIKKPEELIQNFINAAISILLSDNKDKIILAFDTNLANTNQLNLTEMLNKIETLKENPKFAILLKNLEIIIAPAEKLYARLNNEKVLGKENIPVYVFVENSSRHITKNLHGIVNTLSYIDQSKMTASTAYYPIFEIVVLSIIYSLDKSLITDHSLLDLINEQNIESVTSDSSDPNILIFALPDATAMDPQAIRKRYRILKQILEQA